MNIKKIKYFIHLVEKERTGSPKDVAEILEVSERTIYLYVKTLKTEFNAPILYNPFRKSYYFERKGKLNWVWVKSI
jgi:transcriptional antiterminator